MNDNNGHFLTDLKNLGKPGAMVKLGKAFLTEERPMILHENDFISMLRDGNEFMEDLQRQNW